MVARTAAPTRHAVALTWTAHSYLSYRVLVNGREVAETAAGAHTVSGLACGKSHTFGVESVDAADGVSRPATVVASTLPC